MVNHTALHGLKSLSQKFELNVEVVDQPSSEELFKVDFLIADKRWSIYIEDEYGDFKANNQLLSIFLTLRSLEDFAESTDFLSWCNLYGLNASDKKWLDYFIRLTEEFDEIKGVLGSIDSFINPMDYQLRSGAYYELLRSI